MKTNVYKTKFYNTNINLILSRHFAFLYNYISIKKKKGEAVKSNMKYCALFMQRSGIIKSHLHLSLVSI